MNTNIILDTFNTFLKQLIASAVADAVKPLQDRIVALEIDTVNWEGAKHVAAKAVQPMQDRIVALEINQSLGRAQADKVNIADLVAELVDGHDFVKSIDAAISKYDFSRRNEVLDLVETVVGNAIEAYDFSDIIDWDNKIEEGINNYDFSDIIEENMPDIVDEDRVQEMINESLDNLTITRN
jgi:hypothetical protein